MIPVLNTETNQLLPKKKPNARDARVNRVRSTLSRAREDLPSHRSLDSGSGGERDASADKECVDNGSARDSEVSPTHLSADDVTSDQPDASSGDRVEVLGSLEKAKNSSTDQVTQVGKPGEVSRTFTKRAAYVSPYLSKERSNVLSLGPSVIRKHSTEAQCDSRRTVTTVISRPSQEQQLCFRPRGDGRESSSSAGSDSVSVDRKPRQV